MAEEEVYVVIGGTKFIGTLEDTKKAIEYTVKVKVSIGSGLVITDASPELTDFLLDLQKRYPWTGKFEQTSVSLGQ